jgi:hypothetical protein
VMSFELFSRSKSGAAPPLDRQYFRQAMNNGVRPSSRRHLYRLSRVCRFSKHLYLRQATESSLGPDYECSKIAGTRQCRRAPAE